MTHGDIWLPLNPGDPRSAMLYCEAWSDGYMSGVGFGALCSSSAIEQCCELSALLAGSPVFHIPSTGAFKPKEGNYLTENFIDSNESDDDPAEIEAMVEAAVEAMERGDAAGALSGALGRMSLPEKLAKGYGVNAHSRPFEAAWSEFLGRREARDDFTPQETAERLALAERDKENIQTACAYFWRDGQFWGLFSCGDHEDSEEWAAAPLIQLAALKRSAGCFGDFPGYLARVTDKDRQALLALTGALEREGVSLEGLFDGKCDAQTRSLIEAAVLEQESASPAAAKRPSGL